MEEEDLVVFPQSVHKVNQTNKISSGDVVKIGVFLWILINAIVSIFMISFFKSRGFPVWSFWLLSIGVNITILIFVYRFLIFDENEKKQEMEVAGTFNRYCRIRGLSPSKVWERINGDIPIFEYQNGGVFVVIKFSYGSSNMSKSAGNELIFRNLFREIALRNLSFSQYVFTESFAQSQEARQYLQKLANCEDPTLRASMGRITKAVFDMSKEFSDTENTYLIVRGRSRVYQEVLLMFISYLEKQLEELPNSFRSVEYVGEKEYVKFLKSHYALEVIDGSKIRVDNYEENGSEMRLELYMVISEDGEVKYNRDFMSRFIPKIKRVN